MIYCNMMIMKLHPFTFNIFIRSPFQIICSLCERLLTKVDASILNVTN